MSFVGVTNGITTGLNIISQGKDLYDSFANQGGSNSGEGNTVVNENHYHITKSKEEIELERQRLELARQQASFNRATARSKHAEDIRNKRKIIDSMAQKKEDNTPLYILGGILFLGFIVVMMKK